jgi:glucose-6-phosphate 1-epimerase
LRLSLQTGPGELVITLRVRNTGNSTFTWTGGLHPYFAVADITQCKLLGLEGLAVQDRYDAAATRQTDDALVFSSAPCERLYAQATELRLQTRGHSVHLRTSGFTQWMVWNPGTAIAQTMADLPEDEWKRFVCIEPVCVDHPVVLAPGEVFEGWLQVRVGESEPS